ncbi:MAG: hypothetical protein QM831_11325 [Kofleriaceae bacterium]
MRIAIVGLALAGCSFVATEAPRPPPGPTACNRDSKPIYADIAATLGAIFAAGFIGIEHGGTAQVAAPITLAGVFGASTVYGAVEVRSCRLEHAQRPAMVARRDAGSDVISVLANY